MLTSRGRNRALLVGVLLCFASFAWGPQAGSQTAPVTRRPLATLELPKGAPGNSFGASVAISGSRILVGAPGVNGTGRAFVFSHLGRRWVETAELKASGASRGDEFGFFVAIDGATAVVGAPGPRAGSGHAYVFSYGAGRWHQVAKLAASDGRSGASFGAPVSISGSEIAVAAIPASNLSGRVYVFEYGSSGWKQVAELHGEPGGVFGTFLSIRGSSLLAIGLVKDRTRVYDFERRSGRWSQAGQLLVSNLKAGVDLTSVALSGSFAVVGAPVLGFGEALVFKTVAGHWKRTAALSATAGLKDTGFGFSVCASDNVIVVGDALYASSVDHAYVYRLSAGTWTEAEVLVFPGEDLKLVGGTLDVERVIQEGVFGDTVVVGDGAYQSYRGRVDVFGV